MTGCWPLRSSHASLPSADRASCYCLQVGARFYNDYGETLQLFWDAPGPNPRGAFLQGSILPGATLRMKSYVGHAFHAELAGEMVWGQKLNDKARQWYTIDRSQKQETTQDLFAGWSLTDQPAAAAAAPPIGIGGIGPAADTTGDGAHDDASPQLTPPPSPRSLLSAPTWRPLASVRWLVALVILNDMMVRNWRRLLC